MKAWFILFVCFTVVGANGLEFPFGSSLTCNGGSCLSLSFQGLKGNSTQYVMEFVYTARPMNYMPMVGANFNVSVVNGPTVYTSKIYEVQMTFLEQKATFNYYANEYLYFDLNLVVNVVGIYLTPLSCTLQAGSNQPVSISSYHIFYSAENHYTVYNNTFSFTV